MAVGTVGRRSRRSFLRRRVFSLRTLTRAVPWLCTALAAWTALRAAARLTSGGLTFAVSGGLTHKRWHISVSEWEEQEPCRREEERLGYEESKAEDWKWKYSTEKLDPTQQEAMASVLEGKNTFIMGGAGTGKTFIVLRILKDLEKQYGDDFNFSVGVCASTGSAAVTIRGATLHHVSGVGVPRFHSDFKAMEKQPYAHVWKQMKVLIIDEISMISGEFFDLLEATVRKIRGGNKPFGGLQVVLVGDMFQLEPIKNRVAEPTKRKIDPSKLQQRKAIFKDGRTRGEELFLNRGLVFQSDAFWELNFNIVRMKQPHRQRSQLEFYDALGALRYCKTRKRQLRAVDYINEHTICYDPNVNVPEDNDSVYLFPRLDDCAKANDARLRAIPGEATTFEATDTEPVAPSLQPGETASSVGVNEIISWAFKKVPKLLELKVGARVTMIANLRNISEGLVNGLQGTVVRINHETPPYTVTVDFDNEGEVQVPEIQFVSDAPGVGRCVRRQLPLTLGWAMTHHKAQGKTMEKAVINPSSFAKGQAYVALSRTRNVKDMVLTRPLRMRDISPNRMSALFEKHCKRPARCRKFVGHWRDTAVPGLWRIGPNVSTKIDASLKLTLQAVAKNKPKSALTKKKKKKMSPAQQKLTWKIAQEKRGKGRSR